MLSFPFCTNQHVEDPEHIKDRSSEIGKESRVRAPAKRIEWTQLTSSFQSVFTRPLGGCGFQKKQGQPPCLGHRVRE
jgi:hypothetical protein